MEAKELLQYVDHTLLAATASWVEIQRLCEEAVKYKTASVCIPPSYVSRVYAAYGEQLNICMVVGFPLGYSTTAAKTMEIEQGIKDGAREFDMVINLGEVKNGEFNKVREEIKILKEAAQDNILKVIIETCYLTQAEKISLCHAVTEAGADYIKTSTGFGTGGALLEDIVLFKQHVGKNVKIKAAGGVKTLSDLEAFLTAGCERIGTSQAVRMVQNQEIKGY